MSDQDIFDENKVTDNAAPTDDQSNDAGKDDNKPDDLLATIVNENGEPKYKSTEEALKGAAAAQDHIKNLESELAKLRDKGNASDKLDELIDVVKQSKGSGKGDEENTSTLKPEDVLGIVKDYISDSKAAESRESNINTVVNTFKTRYGKDASEKLYGKAEDLGFSKEEINRMIASNPNAALKVLGEDKVKEKSADPVAGKGGVATANFQGKPEAKPTTIMGSSSSAELTDAWRASQRKTLERLGYNPDEVKFK